MNDLTSILKVLKGHHVRFRQVEIFITKYAPNKSENESVHEFIFSAFILTSRKALIYHTPS